MKLNLVSEKTAIWCSNAASIGVSWYVGRGLFHSVATSGVAGLVSYLTSLGEKKLADLYLTHNLTKRCDELQTIRQQLKPYCETDISWCKLDLQIINALNKAESNPSMEDYEIIYRYHKLLSAYLQKLEMHQLKQSQPDDIYVHCFN